MNTVEDYIRKSNELIDDGRLSEAAQLIESSLQLFDSELQSLLYCLLCIHSIGQDKNRVLECFGRATKLGVWWAPSMISADSDFAWLLNDRDFKRELNRMKVLLDSASAGVQSRTKDISHGTGAVSIVNLHKKNNSIVRTVSNFEESNRSLGVRTRYVQSSQVSSSNGFSWDDIDKSLSELAVAIEDFGNDDSILCGTSQGGNIAFIHALVSGKHYLGVMPATSPESLGRISGKPKGSFVFLVGDDDPYRANVLKAHEQLKNVGARSEVVSTGSVGHWLPNDFRKYYEGAVAKLSATF